MPTNSCDTLSSDPYATRLLSGILAGEAPSQDPGHFLELLACSQGRRLDDQRVSLSHFPGLRLSCSSPPPTLSTSKPEQAHTQGDHNTTTSTHQPAAGTRLNVYSLFKHILVFLLPQPPPPAATLPLHPPPVVALTALLSLPKGTTSSTCLSSAR